MDQLATVLVHLVLLQFFQQLQVQVVDTEVRKVNLEILGDQEEGQEDLLVLLVLQETRHQLVHHKVIQVEQEDLDKQDQEEVEQVQQEVHLQVQQVVELLV